MFWILNGLFEPVDSG